MLKILSPKEIKYLLDKYVVGQDYAKKVLSVAAYQHQLRCSQMADSVFMEKSNALLVGETGCGKTLLARTLASILDVPVHIQDCTKLTASGYAGSDVEDCLVGLLRSTNYDVKKAEQGIVVLDEVDKIARRSTDAYHFLDVSGECVQQGLLKIIEGCKVGVPPAGGKKHPDQPLIYMDSSRILFIACGSFPGMVETEADKSSGISCLNRTISPNILYGYGMLREFIGRFSYLVKMDKLSISDMVSILTEPVNSLVSQYETLLANGGIRLEIENAALLAIAEQAVKLETGARGLRNLMDSLLLDTIFDSLGQRKKRTVRLTKDLVYTLYPLDSEAKT